MSKKHRPTKTKRVHSHGTPHSSPGTPAFNSPANSNSRKQQTPHIPTPLSINATAATRKGTARANGRGTPSALSSALNSPSAIFLPPSNNSNNNSNTSDNLAEAIKKALHELLSDMDFVTNLVSSIKSTLMKEIGQSIRDDIVDSINFDSSSLNDQISQLQSQIHEMESNLDEAEQYSRRNCLIFNGISESEKENTDGIIMDICNKKLGVTVTASDIDRSHRLAQPPTSTSTSTSTKPRPRNIIVKFANHRAREAIYRARFKLKFSKDEDRIFINENLTRKRNKLFWKVKKLSFVTRAWTENGKIYARNADGVRVSITRDTEFSRVMSLDKSKSH